MNAEFEVIAERELTLVSNEKQGSVTVSLGRPYREADGAYLCPFRVKGLGKELSREAGGVDGIQAMQLALVMIGAELSLYGESLRWGTSQSIGFPKSIHDPALGDPE